MLRARASRAVRTGLAGVALAVATLTAGATAASAAPAQVPCSNAGGGHYDCQFYVPGDGRSGGTPVQSADGKTVGYLHKGTNWVVCQQAGGRVDYGGHYNGVWAWTLSDGNPAWGWVNAVYASGGGDDGGYGGGVPACAGAHGAPPGTPAGTSGGPSAPAAPPTGQGAAPAPKNRCDDVREDQRATLRFTYTFQHYTFDKSQVPAKPFHERNSTYPVGSMKLGAATCRTGKKWRILKPVSVSWESVGVDVTPKLEPIGDGWSKGWGIGVKQARVPRNSPWPVLDVPMMRCTKGSLLAGVKELLGVPIPKLNFFWALVVWGASKVIPDDAVKCQQPARYRVELHADGRGKLYVIAPMSDFDPYTDETHIPDPGRPSTVEVQRIKADEARIS